ncbi:hypothetical protein [Nostoc sp.]|uniref:hypothetical protein n=1 Tax=Nostoc sp. TaxID=1180 RepID=UPI002FFCFFE4
MLKSAAVQPLGKAIYIEVVPWTVLYHPLALNPSALDIRHQLIKILVEWQIKSKNTHPIFV